MSKTPNFVLEAKRKYNAEILKNAPADIKALAQAMFDYGKKWGKEQGILPLDEDAFESLGKADRIAALISTSGLSAKSRAVWADICSILLGEAVPDRLTCGGGLAQNRSVNTTTNKKVLLVPTVGIGSYKTGELYFISRSGASNPVGMTTTGRSLGTCGMYQSQSRLGTLNETIIALCDLASNCPELIHKWAKQYGTDKKD